MLKSGICPKCQGRKFWRIDEMREKAPGQYQALPVAVLRQWGGMVWHAAGSFQTIICTGCGFTEWYANALDKVKEDPENGVYLIDLEPKPGLR